MLYDDYVRLGSFVQLVKEMDSLRLIVKRLQDKVSVYTHVVEGLSEDVATLKMRLLEK